MPELKLPAPCYLATNRGFYCGGYPVDYNYVNLNDCQVFTSNIRRATAFSSFTEAEECFRLLKTHVDNHSSLDMANYFAIVSGLQTPVVTTAEDSARGRVRIQL